MSKGKDLDHNPSHLQESRLQRQQRRVSLLGRAPRRRWQDTSAPPRFVDRRSAAGGGDGIGSALGRRVATTAVLLESWHYYA